MSNKKKKETKEQKVANVQNKNMSAEIVCHLPSFIPPRAFLDMKNDKEVNAQTNS